MTHLGARELIDLVLDEGSWDSWDTAPDRAGVSLDYAQALARAAERSGVDESVISGEGTLRGRRVAVVA
ncbi:MAG: carboxyl transferase, partial [Marmoricola sp.]|nr:carboxyl transferase [Marmoricola sp.]